jgi:hypothetical protein
MCKKFAYIATIVPLPLLILGIVFGSLANGLRLDFLGYFSAILLLASGISYLASLILTITYGFVSRRSPLLFTPTTSLLLIALFVGFLPDNVHEHPWRAIDISIFAGLTVLNIAQIFSLRRKSPATAGGNLD